MTCCQIHYMNIVSNPSSIWCIIIIAKYTQTFSLANCYLRYIRYQVVWNTFWVFPNDTTLMSADWIKVTE